jgi:hypothetical protein
MTLQNLTAATYITQTVGHKTKIRIHFYFLVDLRYSYRLDNINATVSFIEFAMRF